MPRGYGGGGKRVPGRRNSIHTSPEAKGLYFKDLKRIVVWLEYTVQVEGDERLG